MQFNLKLLNSYEFPCNVKVQHESLNSRTNIKINVHLRISHGNP